MATWILIVLLKSGFGGQFSTIPFQSETACMEAMKSLKNDVDSFYEADCISTATGKSSGNSSYTRKKPQ